MGQKGQAPSEPVPYLVLMGEVSFRQMVDQLLALGVRRGGVLLVHSAFSAIRPVEGGPLGLIGALREAVGPGGTVVMPTMTDGEAVFDPKSTPSVGMGITAELFWRQPGVLRSGHPGGSGCGAFGGPDLPSPTSLPTSRSRQPCGTGPRARWTGPAPGRHPQRGHHAASGRGPRGGPYSVAHPCVVEVEGVPATVDGSETDHCCVGFRIADDWLRARGLQREGSVGNADARLCRSADVVALALEHLASDPLRFLCPPAEGCTECDVARASVPL